MLRSLVWIGLALAATGAAGCGGGECASVFCGPCPPALTVHVRDADTSEPVPDVTVEGAEGQCTVRERETVCELGNRRGAGSYELTLSAPGYMSRTVSQRVREDPSPGCCSCGYEPVTVDVMLQAG